MLNHTINPDDDQPLVLVTAPIGSAAFQVGGSTIHSAFLLYDKSRTKPSWEKHSIMQLKLQKLMLSITDEISMVSFKQYQQMNETMSIVKGTCNSNWGDICVLAVGDLYQLPPLGQCPIYISPHTAHTLDDFAPNGWEDMKLHELTEIMQQKDIHFAQNLNKIQLAVPQQGSKEDRMLQGCELQVNEDHDCYQKDVTHVYAQNHYCDEWNNKRITSLQGDTYECVAYDSKKDHCTELTMIDISLKPQKTGNLRKVLHVKVGARVMLTTNVDVSDGLTNGAVGTVKYVITEEITKRVKVILVEFDKRDVGQEAKSNS